MNVRNAKRKNERKIEMYWTIAWYTRHISNSIFSYIVIGNFFSLHLILLNKFESNKQQQYGCAACTRKSQFCICTFMIWFSCLILFSLFSSLFNDEKEEIEQEWNRLWLRMCLCVCLRKWCVTGGNTWIWAIARRICVHSIHINWV